MGQLTTETSSWDDPPSNFEWEEGKKTQTFFVACLLARKKSGGGRTRDVEKLDVLPLLVVFLLKWDDV